MALFIFALAMSFVFLVLAAQYESWTLPLAVIMVVPMCLLCSISGVSMVGGEVDIFTQIGFVVLVGRLATCKNAILDCRGCQGQAGGGSRSPARSQLGGSPRAAATDPP